jgi:hypothetical protein
MLSVLLEHQGPSDCRSASVDFDVVAIEQGVVSKEELDEVGEHPLAARISERASKGMPREGGCHSKLVSREPFNEQLNVIPVGLEIGWSGIVVLVVDIGVQRVDR